MNPLNREDDILSPGIVREAVLIDQALTRESQFERWLNSLPDQHCHRHKRTPSVLDRAASREASLKRPAEYIYFAWSRSYVEVPLPPKSSMCHPFEAVFRCPGCKVRYSQAPPEFHESSFKDFQTPTEELTTNLVRCHHFVARVNQHECGMLLMSGFTGTGKTRLACNAVREVNNTDALYVTQGHITTVHRATYGQRFHHLIRPPYRGQDEKDMTPPSVPKTITEVCQEVFLLVLDEIGCKALASDEQLILDEVLKHRYDHRKPTILVTNLVLTGTPEKPGLKEFLGDALTDRIRHATGNGKFILQFSGESFRRGGGEDYLPGLP